MIATLQRYARGEVPLGRVFLFDMLLVGTIVNIVTAGVALIAHLNEFPGWLVLLLFLLPFPYNLALCCFVWRSAARSRSIWGDVARLGALIWLAVGLVV